MTLALEVSEDLVAGALSASSLSLPFFTVGGPKTKIEDIVRILIGIVVGFVAATAATTAMSLVGLGEPALIGGMHLVLWGVVAWRIAAKRQPEAPVSPDESSSLAPAAGTETHHPLRVSEGHHGDTEDSVAGSREEPGANCDAPQSKAALMPNGRTSRRGRVALAVIGGLMVVGASAGAAYFASQAAITAALATTTTLATTEAEILAWEDLTDAERAWCSRDRQTFFAVLRAAEILGFHDFSANLFDYRDGESGSGDAVQADLDRWEQRDGAATQDRQLAIACRAAFEGRNAG